MKGLTGFKSVSEMNLAEMLLANKVLQKNKEKYPNMNFMIESFRVDSNGKMELITECQICLS